VVVLVVVAVVVLYVVVQDGSVARAPHTFFCHLLRFGQAWVYQNKLSTSFRLRAQLGLLVSLVVVVAVVVVVVAVVVAAVAVAAGVVVLVVVAVVVLCVAVQDGSVARATHFPLSFASFWVRMGKSG